MFITLVCIVVLIKWKSSCFAQIIGSRDLHEWLYPIKIHWNSSISWSNQMKWSLNCLWRIAGVDCLCWKLWSAWLKWKFMSTFCFYCTAAWKGISSQNVKSILANLFWKQYHNQDAFSSKFTLEPTDLHKLNCIRVLIGRCNNYYILPVCSFY